MMLAQEVERWIGAHPELDKYALAAAEAPVATPEVIDFARFEVSGPVQLDEALTGVRETQAAYGAKLRVGRKHDYAAREARNASLGRAGEELVVKFEQYRLSRLGLEKLAGKVEHVSKTQGDGLGFDVLSFDEKGRERFIEVKTTAFAKETPFFASAGELSFARQNTNSFSLYRLFEFKKDPRCYTVSGAFEDYCILDPVTYRCSVA